MKLPIGDIKPNPDNPRLIKDDKFKKLVQSLKDFPEMSEVREVVVNKEHMILGGNMRYKAMQEAGWKEVPVRLVDWSPEKQREFVIKDNLALGEMDWDVIANEWTDLPLEDWGLDLPTGFGDEEVEEDEAPPVADVAISKLGEVYRLGRHRLMCGDALKDAGALIDKDITMVFTDPPWNVAIGLDSNPRHRQREGLDNDNLSSEDFGDFVNNFSGVYAKYCKGDFYCVLGAAEWPTLDSNLRSNGFHWSATIIWVKDIFVLGRSKYHRRYEPLWYGWHEQGKSSYNGKRDLDDVWEIKRPKVSKEHPHHEAH